MVQNFRMLDLVKKVLASHKCQMDRSREQYTRDLAGMLLQLSDNMGYFYVRLQLWCKTGACEAHAGAVGML